MAHDPLFDLIAAIRAEFGVRTGRNKWLNIATVGDLHEHVAFALGARSDAARAQQWARVAAVVARVTGLPAEGIGPTRLSPRPLAGDRDASRPVS